MPRTMTSHDIETKLQQVRGQVGEEWRPQRFDLSRGEERAALERLVDDGAVLFCHDTIDEQVRDLAVVLSPSRKLEGATLEAEVRGLLAGKSLVEYGAWFFYPWSGRLVHLLPEREFWALRSDRNRNKITAAEQRSLRARRIGIVGLSVGNAVASTMAIEGVAGGFRLADFDTLALSNLNRLRAGAHQLGGNKAVLTARELGEIDPYLDLTVFTRGVDDSNMDAFLLEGGKLDLVVDGCDDLYVKVRIRERARDLGIPVIMNTSDRGLSDIERFDLEPDRPVFHGLIQDLRAADLRGLSLREKIPFALKIMGEGISPAALASLGEIGKTISTWPQLASSVTMDAGFSANIARRIFLGGLRQSGRFYVDIDAIVRDGGGVATPADPGRGLGA